MNHDTLSKFELPLLRNLGFEIYTPKVVPKEILQASGSVVFDYDKTLTIPEEDIKVLNQYNFYQNEEMPFFIKHLVNKYFDIAFVMFDFYALQKLIVGFEGHIFARAFGLGDNIAYTDITQKVYSEGLLLKLEQIKERFWFSQCYSNISENETGIFNEKALFMPLGLPDDFYNIENEWNGNEQKLLFFCSRIKVFEESERIYRQFKKDFSGFDYIIAGNQPIPVDDPQVTGFLEREQLNELYKCCKVMFYHSTYPRHVHYHPLEAMIAGMPVVYLQGGLLNILGGERQSGCCRNINEAREKVRRILDGDTELINNIKRDQREILFKFSYEFNEFHWKKNFLPLVETFSPKHTQEKSIAVFAKTNQLNNHKSDYIELIKVLDKSFKSVNPNNRLILNVVQNKYDLENDFGELINSGVSTREFSFELSTSNDLIDSLTLMFKQEPLWFDNYLLPTDHVKNFVDADYWLFLDFSQTLPIAPIKPYGILIDSLTDRYYESLSKIQIFNIKMASFILTYSEYTKKELTKHLGIDERKVMTIPFVRYKSDVKSILLNKERYIFIELDFKRKEIVSKLFNDILDFYRLSHSSQTIKVFFNNYDPENDLGYINEMNAFVKDSDLLKDTVELYTNLRDNEYNALFTNALKIIIPYHIENIFFKLAKAATYRKKLILSDFPIYREFESSLLYEFIYVNFNQHQNVMLDLLCEEDLPLDRSIASVDNFTSSNSHFEGISDIWRKLM
ncbi:hypothetical protein LBW89_12915 [Paenibacillus sp. alder61]|uniref:hypothetical protein n=1 Tax=Paenibacillus sp. alder61 TaxID=2862948 RepID=UPI001CD3F305|nr:hypothetical protein [Paenibacillus sp. alder61]MCA1293921.1 hypothetical protein [Paenibacillus sp. alder61]